jgi:acetylornithine deacetylase/succinyl-diaminopimelate desuccinylase-like protein
MLRNTISLTVLKSGYKTNVIPADAIAELDCRLLPDVDHEKFIEDIKHKLHDPSIEVSIIEWDKAQPSSEKTELFEAIKAIAHEESPNVPVVPVVTSWFTDSHFFRELGIISYGWEPIEQDAYHVGTVHGKNERVPIKFLNAGVERMYKLLLKLGAPSAS